MPPPSMPRRTRGSPHGPGSVATTSCCRSYRTSLSARGVPCCVSAPARAPSQSKSTTRGQSRWVRADAAALAFVPGRDHVYVLVEIMFASG
eukprot:361051-Chlamydomonas_euryale.AAC.5